MNATLVIIAIITFNGSGTPLFVQKNIPIGIQGFHLHRLESCKDAKRLAQPYIDGLYLDKKYKVMAAPKWRCQVEA